MIRLPEEILVFGRLAAFGLVVGTLYWFVAYETVGTVLLLGFGAATAVASAILWTRSRKAGGAADERQFGSEPGQIPAPAYAPFHVGVGAAIMALGLVFGPLLALTGFVVVVIGARSWLEAAMREADASTAQDRQGRRPPS
jgi:cytochrome c oxidase subunit IV